MYRHGRLESVNAVPALTIFRVAKVPYDAIENERSYKKNLELLRSHWTVFPTGADLKVYLVHFKGTRAIKRYSKGLYVLQLSKGPLKVPVTPTT